MLFKYTTLFLFFATALSKEQISVIPNVDHVFDSLSKQQWHPDEASCRDRIFNILENVKNSTLWATWVWNSIEQSPTGIFFGARYHLGNYDQCLRPPWLSTHPELRTQYCLAEMEMNKGDVKITETVNNPYVKAEDYLKTKTRFGRRFSYIAYGFCLPAGCPTKSVDKFAKALINTGYLHAAINASVSIHHCEEAGASHEYSRGFYVYISTLVALLFTAVASTYYVSEYPITAASDTFVNHLAKSFCLRRNWDTVFKEDDKDALTCLHGIRFLTATSITVVHSISFIHGTSVSNGLDLDQIIDKPETAIGIIHFDVYVDTFFAMSALLLGKSLATLDITKPYIIIKNILKRYIRLIGPFAVTVLYLAYVSMHTDDGPLYPKLALLEQQACEKNWWLGLLMVGNYVNTLEMCHPATWYIPCDFHFYVITLVLLYLYRKNPCVGTSAAAVVLVMGFVAPAISTYIYDLPAVVAYDFGLITNIRNNKFFNYGYIRTHNRMGPYVAGLVVGYFMSIYKPKDYKKVWSKTVSFLGAYASLILMLAVLGLGMLCYTNAVQGLLACVYTLFNRTTFAIAVLGVIVFCTYGDVPLINSFLSWSVFVPLGRLSYGVYVIHLVILYRCTISLRDSLKHHVFDITKDALGLVVVSLMLSLAVWLLVEAPLINVTNRYLNTKAPKNEKEEEGGRRFEFIAMNKQKSNHLGCVLVRRWKIKQIVPT